MFGSIFFFWHIPIDIIFFASAILNRKHSSSSRPSRVSFFLFPHFFFLSSVRSAREIFSFFFFCGLLLGFVCNHAKLYGQDRAR
ncbi:hypothetical protein BDY21DRAFT_337932 [Lineolata rhizophorae]|uniref:Uncharacterized protein n=1 Tax=Lineolata rhizophorae TaxID=578093 RepID=A0A6A6P5P5_9PEZI|nr:hypothetical protein BDY21DRAFT_337932 [Lineolata rhizophorae]